MNTRKLFSAGAVVLALLLLVAVPMVLAQGNTPSVTVSDQPIVNGAVKVDSVVSDGPGWITIHADQNNAPGDVIGYAPVQDGANSNVTVEITQTLATPQLFAMLHVDKGVVGQYEFPGPDVPTVLNGEIVMEPFTVTAGIEPTATVTPIVTGTSTAVPTVGVTSTVSAGGTPSTLPTTGGGSIPWSLVVLALGGLILIGGMGLALARRS